ncbi:MAG TPA: hypothetical protein VHB21_15040, partial [Minicystis sp.]|nr:hypothetical protein [Minicystis sp.]
IHLRAELGGLVLALAAQLGATMVSYASAKAEVLRVEAPRGVMRRVERAVYLAAGLAVTPVVDALHLPIPKDAPLVLALLVIAVLANLSAVRRLRFVAGVLRDRRAA